MDNMFYLCENLQSIDVSHFDTRKVTKMNHMFHGCTSLTSLDVSNFNTSKVDDMQGMFQDLRVSTLDVSSFETSLVIDMSGMFADCPNLTTIFASDNFVTPSVIRGQYMFSRSTNLVGINGTTYSSSRVDASYAHIDGGTSNPGYFSAR